MAPKSMQEFGALRNVKSLKSVIRIVFFKGSHFGIPGTPDSETAPMHIKNKDETVLDN